MLRVPVSVGMLGREIPITLDSSHFVAIDEANDFGHTADGPAIYLNNIKHSSQAELDSTLFHELVHAALKITGLSELFAGKSEEALVVGLENAMVPVIRELVHAGHFRYEPTKGKKKHV